MTARTDLAAALRLALPTSWPVYAYPDDPDAVAKPQVYVFQSSIRPTGHAGAGMFEITLKVYVLVSLDLGPVARENTLDEALARVLDVLDTAAWVSLGDAERTTTSGFPSYEITATAVGKKEA